MNRTLQLQVLALKDKLKLESYRYYTFIRDGNFIEAKAIKSRINELELEMDTLLPYVAKDDGVTNA